jgi:hypothetical protein
MNSICPTLMIGMYSPPPYGPTPDSSSPRISTTSPPDVLRHHDLEALTPDVFVLRLVDHAPTTVLRALEAQADALRAPPIGLDDLLTQLATCSLPRSVAAIRSHLR